MKLKHFIWVLVISLPLQFALNAGDGFDLVTTRVVIPIFFLLWLVNGLAQGRIMLSWRIETSMTLLYMFFSIFSLVVVFDLSLGLRKALYYLSVVPIYFVLSDIFRDPELRFKGLVAVVWSGLIAAIIGIIQFCLQFPLGLGKEVQFFRNAAPYLWGKTFGEMVATNPSWLVNLGGETRLRAFGLFPDPHMYSFFVSMCFFMALGCIFALNVSRRMRIFSGLSAALMLVAVILSFARGAYLGLGVGLAFFMLVSFRKAEWLRYGLVAGLLGIILIIGLNTNSFLQRMSSAFNLREGSNMERLENWSQAIEIIKLKPMLGTGLGGYAAEVEPSLSGERTSIYAHNLYLDIMAETGILNGVVFLVLIGVSIVRQLYFSNYQNLGIASALIYFAVHSIFDTPLFSPPVLCLFFLLIAAGLYSYSQNKVNAKQET